MKAAPLSSKPGFTLMKQTDVQSFYHLQMPRWLFFDKKYMPLSLEAKVAYTFLLNRFQLSKLNGWINPDGEVFIIYTRESLAAEMQISYRRVIDCMKELAALKLIWEKRCGRGDANQIYLAKVELTDESASVYTSAPFVTPGDEEAGSRPAETACLKSGGDDEISAEQPDPAQSRPAESAHQDLRKPHLLTCGNGTSRPADSALADLRFLHPSNTNKKNIELNHTDSQSVRHARDPTGIDRRTDDDTADLEEIIENCELWTFPEETAKVFESAIERLYFTDNYRIGNCVLPQKKVRSHLWALDSMKLQDAEHKIAANTETKIKNTTAYVMAVIFNSIWESESDLLCDPYLNSLRSRPAASGGG